jgi:hypothetical protein
MPWSKNIGDYRAPQTGFVLTVYNAAPYASTFLGDVGCG